MSKLYLGILADLFAHLLVRTSKILKVKLISHMHYSIGSACHSASRSTRKSLDVDRSGGGGGGGD